MLFFPAFCTCPKQSLIELNYTNITSHDNYRLTKCTNLLVIYDILSLRLHLYGFRYKLSDREIKAMVKLRN